jgi:hypothetical protein
MILGALFIICFVAFPHRTFSGMSKDEREAGLGVISVFAFSELIIEAFTVVAMI